MKQSLSLPEKFMAIHFFHSQDFYQDLFHGQRYEIIGKDDMGNLIGVDFKGGCFIWTPLTKEKKFSIFPRILQHWQEKYRHINTV